MTDAKEPELQVVAKSPVALMVIAPDAEIITRAMVQSPTMEYQIYDINEDGNLDDIVIGGEKKTGHYRITVIPDPGALPTETYTLEFTAGSITLVLAKDVQISDMPAQPYIILSTEEGIEPVITVIIDIKPGSDANSINLGSKGVIPVAILSSSDFDATQVDPSTVSLGGAGVAIKGKGNKSMSHVEDVNGDGLLDVVIQVETENFDPTQFQDGEAILTGETYDGQAIEGSDEISIVPPEAAPVKPSEFALYQNFSNPFNPDTWIPYQLAEDVDVNIRIYDVSGKLIRTLDLGHKIAGFYITKDRAAYWDGKDEAGEQVASGVYFYTIQAGGFTATKKMVVAR